MYHKTRERMKRRLAYWVTGPKPQLSAAEHAEREQDERNQRHRDEVARAFETLDRLWGTTLDSEWWRR